LPQRADEPGLYGQRGRLGRVRTGWLRIDFDTVMPPRRFPPPWIVEETEAAFVVRDHGGQALDYVYFEDEPGRRAAAKLLTKDEARRIAANIAKLRGLLRRSASCE
jgi:hypothetical protein